MRIALVDYGAGNLASVRKALQACGADVFVPAEAAALAAAAAVVIPGVGHFAATAALGAEWRLAVRAFVDDGRPVLGICLGQQWLFEGSSEAPDVPGLGVLAGRCAHLRELARERRASAAVAGDAQADGVKVPHVGWNDVTPVRPSVLLAGVDPREQAYFTHAYAAPVTADTAATTVHDARFASVVCRGRVYGVQFHPEKSGTLGLAVLGNFLRFAGGR
jgi:glutamine amidotransferase